MLSSVIVVTITSALALVVFVRFIVVSAWRERMLRGSGVPLQFRPRRLSDRQGDSGFGHTSSARHGENGASVVHIGQGRINPAKAFKSGATVFSPRFHSICPSSVKYLVIVEDAVSCPESSSHDEIFQ